MYFVYRRTGGDLPTHIDIINVIDRRRALRRFAEHRRCQFEILLETDNWATARDFLAETPLEPPQ